MDAPASAPALTDRDRSITMIGILTAMFLAALDQSIVAPAMPTIGGDLGNAQYLPWIVTAYLLAATAVAPLYGRISDTYGRRKTIYWALGLFLLGSVIAALSPNIFVLIVARGIQGLGGGGLFALSQILIGDLLPPRERGRYAAWISGMWAVAGIAGPLLGGTLAQYYWPLIFWLNLPLGILAAIVIDGPLRRLTVAIHPHRLDVPGSVLLIAATTALLLLLNWGGTTYTWASAQIIGLGLLSAMLWIGFGLRIARAAEPLISLEVLTNPIVLASCLGMFLVGGVNIGLAVLLPVYLQGYFGFSPALSGYGLLGLLVGAVVGSTIGGRLTLHLVHVKRIPAVGAAICGFGIIALGLIVHLTSLPLLEVLLVVLGIGMGLTFPVTTVSVQNAVDQKHLGVATGVLTFLRSLGSALGVAILGAIALGLGLPLGAETGAVQVSRIADPGPFAVLHYFMAGMMLLAALIYMLMPHKPLRGRVTAAPVE
jgi:EmrB/QacA subfamily drug resistance transporter